MESSTINKKRILWVDICRITAFIYIALSHSTAVFCEHQIAVRGSVGIFFLLAAYFSAEKTALTILKRSCILLIGIIVWHTVIELVINRSLPDYSHPLNLFCDLRHLWFLRELIICMILSLILRRLNIAGLLMLTGILIASYSNAIKYLPPQSTIFALIFYNSGILIKRLCQGDLARFVFPIAEKIHDKHLNFLLALVVFCAIPLFEFFHPQALPLFACSMIAMSLIAIFAIFTEKSNNSFRFGKAVSGLAQAGFLFYVSHCLVLRAFVSCHIKLTGCFLGLAPCIVAILSYFILCAIFVRCVAHRNRYLDMILLGN